MTEQCLSPVVAIPDRTAPRATLPFISVIVPVRNEEAFIASTLEQLLTQRYDSDRFEILVAEGCSTDATPAIVRYLAAVHPNLHLLHNPGRLSSAGRNVALRSARGDVVVVVDGHCEVDNRNYLRELAEVFARDNVDCAGRPQPLELSRATPVQRAIAVARSSRLGHNPASFIYSSWEGFVPPQSVAVAYRRSVIEAVGLFDETFDACEDVEFNHRVDRAGLRCFFTPRLRVRYHPRASLNGLFRQMMRYGSGRVRLLRKHPETFSWTCFLPAFFLLGVLAGPLAVALFRPLAPFYLGTLAMYALSVLLTSLGLSVRARDWRLLLWLPLVFVAIHAGAGAGILSEGLTGRRARRVAQPGLPLQEPLIGS
jgi:succinoglycan biosynthesis protein ExoA